MINENAKETLFCFQTVHCLCVIIDFSTAFATVNRFVLLLQIKDPILTTEEKLKKSTPRISGYAK